MASKAPGACMSIFIHFVAWQGLWGSCGDELGPVWEVLWVGGCVGRMDGGQISVPYFSDQLLRAAVWPLVGEHWPGVLEAGQRRTALVTQHLEWRCVHWSLLVTGLFLPKLPSYGQELTAWAVPACGAMDWAFEAPGTNQPAWEGEPTGGWGLTSDVAGSTPGDVGDLAVSGGLPYRAAGQ